MKSTAEEADRARIAETADGSDAASGGRWPSVDKGGPDWLQLALREMPNDARKKLIERCA
jgi:hypothetical protein